MDNLVLFVDYAFIYKTFFLLSFGGQPPLFLWIKKWNFCGIVETKGIIEVFKMYFYKMRMNKYKIKNVIHTIYPQCGIIVHARVENFFIKVGKNH